MSESFGMMNEAYFVGRSELIKWVNEFLKVSIAKVEDCANGAIHCQLFDALFPGSVAMHKVNFDAKYDYEMVKNYKVLQDVFYQNGISKVIPVDRIIKARSQDNLEFLQWVYEYFNRNYVESDYDPIKRRAKAKGGKTRSGTSGRATASTRGKENKFSSGASSSRAKGTKPIKSARSTGGSAELAAAKVEMARQNVVITELEKERDFYFGKIVKVEKLIKDLQAGENDDPTAYEKILEILYEADGMDEEERIDQGEVLVE